MGSRKSDEDSYSDSTLEGQKYGIYTRGRLWIFLSIISIAINILLTGALMAFGDNNLSRQSPLRSDRLYSPAQHVLSRVDRVFDSGFGDGVTPYQGTPNSSNNELWKELYNDIGISRISADEARNMVNHTLPIPDDYGYYITSLSVFHQLHCLNLVRQGLYGHVDWSNKDELFGIEHLDHCIDAIRQSLQCNADITPLTFIWSEERNRALEEARAIHTCVDFSAIQRWAAEHVMRVPFNFSAKISNDPLRWGAGVHDVAQV